jgi:hypothetical protein
MVDVCGLSSCCYTITSGDCFTRNGAIGGLACRLTSVTAHFARNIINQDAEEVPTN